MKNNRVKKHMIYKKDNWNMMSVEVNGKQLIVREISDQWGEESHIFLSRPAMMQWVSERFADDRFVGSEEEREEIIRAFQEV